MTENKNVNGVDRYVPVGLVKKMLGLIEASIDDGDGFDRYEWLDFVEQMPSVYLVRCKGCKYAHMTHDGDCKYCDIWFPDTATYAAGDYYCGSGMPKEGREE